jgi:uncharacterized protein YcfJ
MHRSITLTAAALALATMSGCATWQGMERSEKGTAVGATSGAVVGAAVGGPVGAAIGAGVGGYVGHHQASDDSTPRVDAPSNAPGDAAYVRSVQQSLNQRGYDVAVDGIWGPNTESALRNFQQANGFSQTGTLDGPTASALGIAR